MRTLDSQRLLQQVSELEKLIRERARLDFSINRLRTQISGSVTTDRQGHNSRGPLSPRLSELMGLLAAEKNPTDPKLFRRLARVMGLSPVTVTQYVSVLRVHFSVRDFPSLVDIAKNGAYEASSRRTSRLNPHLKRQKQRQKQSHWMQKPENRERVLQLMKKMSSKRHAAAEAHAETSATAPAEAHVESVTSDDVAGS